MKVGRLLNSDLSRVIALMGHGDTLGIGDAGLPIPASTERIDLALVPGVPSFLETLEAVLTELQVEKVLLAEEFSQVSPELHSRVMAVLDAYGRKTSRTISATYVTHEVFKQQTAASKALVRTGEFTPYANILLFSGVVF